MIMGHTIKICLQPALQWRHNGRDGVSNHQLHDCLLNRLFRRRSKKTPKLRVTGLCVGNSPVIGEFPAQKASNAENVSIRWRHHEIFIKKTVSMIERVEQMILTTFCFSLQDPCMGQTIVIDREKGKIEPVANGSIPKKNKSCLNGPIVKAPNFDTLNNNDTRLIIANGAPKSDLSKLLTEGDRLYHPVSPNGVKNHDGVVQNVGYTNQILPRKDLSFYRSNVSSLAAHELALNYLNQRKSCAVPSPGGRQRNPSGLERRTAVIGDSGLPLYETRTPATQLPGVARKSALSRHYCIAIAVVLGILLLALVFVPVAWVTSKYTLMTCAKSIQEYTSLTDTSTARRLVANQREVMTRLLELL